MPCWIPSPWSWSPHASINMSKMDRRGHLSVPRSPYKQMHRSPVFPACPTPRVPHRRLTGSPPDAFLWISRPHGRPADPRNISNNCQRLDERYRVAAGSGPMYITCSSRREQLDIDAAALLNSAWARSAVATRAASRGTCSRDQPLDVASAPGFSRSDADGQTVFTPKARSSQRQRPAVPNKAHRQPGSRSLRPRPACRSQRRTVIVVLRGRAAATVGKIQTASSSTRPPGPNGRNLRRNGARHANAGTPGQKRFVPLQQCFVETSNVNVVEEFSACPRTRLRAQLPAIKTLTRCRASDALYLRPQALRCDVSIHPLVIVSPRPRWRCDTRARR